MPHPSPRKVNGDARPTLVYDGDCGICRYWVDYWQALTGERVAYRPYQAAAADFRRFQSLRFAALFSSSSRRAGVFGSGRHLPLVARHPGRSAWWWLYAHLPGFAPASEGPMRSSRTGEGC
jgi:hypothetical protein